MFSKKHFIKTIEKKHSNGLFMIGLLKVKAGERLVFGYEELNREIKLISKESEFNFDEKVKEMKSCKHKEFGIGTLEFERQYEKLEFFHYCEGCGRVLEDYILSTANTQVLNEIKYAETRCKEADERIKRFKESIEYQMKQKQKYEREIEELKTKLI